MIIPLLPVVFTLGFITVLLAALDGKLHIPLLFVI
jgi:hypothetical protein